jgi:hypothetical protein
MRTAFTVGLAILASLVLAAHFVRAGLLPVALVVLSSPLLLLFPGRWAANTLGGILALGSLVWVWVAKSNIDFRRANGLDWHRLAAIMGTVALVTALAAILAFRRPPPRTGGGKPPE